MPTPWLASAEARRDTIERMARLTPLTFTAGINALSSWLESPEQGLSIFSATGRHVSFYLGPARRTFGDPADVLKRGRGRVALVIDRALLREATAPQWTIAPFDLGEVLYHWRSGRILDEYLTLQALEQVRACQYDVSELTERFRLFLDEAYEDPTDYLRSWIPPRPSLEFPPFVNAVYRAAGDRWFGRVRPFAQGWTFEVSYEKPGDPATAPVSAVVPPELVIAIVIIRDEVTRRLPIEDTLGRVFEGRMEVLDMPLEIEHPDVRALLLEARTAAIIRRYLEP